MDKLQSAVTGRNSVELSPAAAARDLHGRVIRRAKGLLITSTEESLERRIAKLLSDKPFQTVISRISDIYGELERLEEELSKEKVEAGVAAPVVAALECPACHNRDQTCFVQRRDGAVVCKGVEGRGCGEVVANDQVFEGSMFRNFSDQADRNSFGPIQDPAFSTGYNLGTMVQRSAVRATKGKSSGAGKETDFSVSNIGRDTGATRIEYKDEQKIKAFQELTTATRSLGIHDRAYGKARIMFTTFRDAKDRLLDFKSTIAACLIAGHLECLEEEGVPENAKPETFSCSHCAAAFNCKIDCDRHVLQEHQNGISHLSSGDLDDVKLQKLDYDGVKKWLESISQRLRTCAPQIVEGLRKAIGDNPSITAGQELVATGPLRLQKWCKGDEQAVGDLVKAIKDINDRRRLREQLEKQEEHQRIRKKQRVEYERTMLGKGLAEALQESKK